MLCQVIQLITLHLAGVIGGCRSHAFKRLDWTLCTTSRTSSAIPPPSPPSCMTRHPFIDSNGITSSLPYLSGSNCQWDCLACPGKPSSPPLPSPWHDIKPDTFRGNLTPTPACPAMEPFPSRAPLPPTTHHPIRGVSSTSHQEISTLLSLD